MPLNIPSSKGDNNKDNNNNYFSTIKVPLLIAISIYSKITISKYLISYTTYTIEGNFITTNCIIIYISTYTSYSIIRITIITFTKAYSIIRGAYINYLKNILNLPKPNIDNNNYISSNPNKLNNKELVNSLGLNYIAK